MEENKKNWTKIIILLVIGVLLLSSVAGLYLTNRVDDTVGASNPASTACVDDGGKAELHTRWDGSKYATCTVNGTTCGQQEYYEKGECE